MTSTSSIRIYNTCRPDGEPIPCLHADTTGENSLDLHFDQAIAFPGLINSHDHLDFNLFPQLGDGPYENYRDWGKDIHQRYRNRIDPVLKIPRRLRTQWGIYKNLLNGVTTVVNHGKPLEAENDLVRVLQPCSLHSLATEKHWKYILNRYYSQPPSFVIHIGEGTDRIAAREVGSLLRWNLFRRQLIGIHGVAMQEEQAVAFRALVWCPDSNFFLLSRTAPIHLLKQHTALLFGTDSTLSASWNLWQQLRLARSQGMTGDAELLESLTTTPARIWGLDRGTDPEGQNQADLVIAKPRTVSGTGWDRFYNLDPEDILLVLRNGQIQYVDESVYQQLTAANYPLQNFYKIQLQEGIKYVKGNLPGLMQEIRRWHPAAEFPVTCPG